MTEDDMPTYDEKVEHSHSRITRFLDELHSIGEAIQSNGTYASHHRDELQLFSERLREDFTDHVAYEEEELFPDVRDELSEVGCEAIERAIDEHRRIDEHLERLESGIEQLEVGQPADSEEVICLIGQIETLEQLTDAHDDTEHEIFDEVGRPH